MSKVAVINSGSSSIRVKLFDMNTEELIDVFFIERIGEKGSKFKNHHDALKSIGIDFNSLDAVGHRVVHGGEEFTKATLITDEVISKIETLCALAPLHNPANLEGILKVKLRAPNIPQIAVFDTSFHSTMAPEAYVYALDYEMYEKHHIRKYGFHGTSHSFVSKEAAKVLKRDLKELNLITLHLGNGASVCAIEKGLSIDTSMGFTPLEGLVMGTRCGDIDAQIPLYMQKNLGLSIEEVERELNKKSGLLGLCGDNDLRSIIKSDNKHAKLALDIMIRRIQKYIGSYMAILGNVDAIVFTGGIGENSSYVRDRVMSSDFFKRIEVLVIKTDEELAIAQESVLLLEMKA